MNAAAALLFASGLLAQAPPPADESLEQRERWAKFYTERASEYELRLEDDPTKQLTLVKTPVLKWSNPLRQGDTNGLVYVWTYQGRAEVVGTIFSYIRRDDESKRQVVHSFHTLSQSPIAFRREDKPFWSPEGPGVRLNPVPDAPPPAESRVGRLSQMKAIARQFTASIPEEGSRLDEGGRSLRRVSRPLHRHEESAGNVLDGAVFAFVMGTDPEVILTIEARRSGGKFGWHFAAGRFSHQPLRVQHKMKTVWEYVPDQSAPSPYFSRGLMQHDAVIAD